MAVSRNQDRIGIAAVTGYPSFHPLGAAGCILIGAVLLFPSSRACGQVHQLSADEPAHRRVALLNAGLTGGLAVIRGLLTDRIDTPGQALRTFTYGAGGGYGFYQSKRLIGQGNIICGLALGYGSVSVVENTSRGQAPLSFLRLGTGPLDVRVRTPFAREITVEEAPRLSIQLNAISAVSSILLPLLDYESSLYKGTLFHRSPHILGNARSHPRRAIAFNRTIVLGPNAPRSDLRHELIHTVQSLQVSAVTPFYRLADLGINVPQAGHSIQWDVQIDWLYTILGLASLRVDYEDRWAEIEAYTLQELAK